MSISVPSVPPPISRVHFQWMYNADPKILELYHVMVDGVQVGTMYKLKEYLWRIDTMHGHKSIIGLGRSADEAKLYWWDNWSRYKPRPNLKLVN